MNYANYSNWLWDFYLVATVLLAVWLAASLLIRQPARRVALGWATCIGLLLAAVLGAAPDWGGWRVAIYRTPAPAPRTDASMALPGAAFPDRALLAAPPIGVPPAERAQAGLDWRRAIAPASTALPWLVGVGSLAGAAWFALGAWQASRLLRGAQCAGPELQAALRSVAGGAPTPRLLVSQRVGAPAAIGLLRPTILLPETMSAPSPAPSPASSPAPASPELCAALAHELAHIRAGDLWLLALLRLVTLVLWAHPLCWLLRRRVRADQELLADAAAADLSSRADYARQLVEWARGLSGRPTPRVAAAIGLWERPSLLKRRVAALLDERLAVLRHCSAGWRWATLGGCAVMAVGLSLVTVAPESVAQVVESRASDAEPDAAKTQANKTQADRTQAEPVVTGEARFVPYGPGLAHSMTSGEGVTLAGDADRPNAIQGVCVNADGSPAAGVALSVYQRGAGADAYTLRATATSGPDGAFALADVAGAAELAGAGAGADFDLQAPRYALIAQQPGAASLQIEFPVQMVAEGVGLKFTLSPAAELTGVVTDQAGKPVAGALVAVARGAGVMPAEGLWSARTDAAGRYVIDDIEPFQQARPAGQPGEGDTLYLAALPSSADGRLMNASNVSPYVTVQLDGYATHRAVCDAVPGTMDVSLLPAAVIEGRVVDIEGKPAPGLTVLAVEQAPDDRPDALPPLSNAWGRAQTDAAGRYEFTGLPAGRYSVTVAPRDALDPLPEWLGPTAAFEADNADAVNRWPDLTLEPGGIVEVRLTDAKTGEPLKLTEAELPASAVIELGVGRTSRTFVAPLDADGLVRVRWRPGASPLRVHSVHSKGATPDAQPKWQDWPKPGENRVVSTERGETTRVDYAMSDHTAVNRVSDAMRYVWKLQSEGKFREAVEGVEKTLAGLDHADERMKPAAINLRRVQAQLYEQLGDDGAARRVYEETLAAGNDMPATENNLAFLLATSPDAKVRDGERAVALAEQAVAYAREHQGPYQLPLHAMLDTLAAAHAEAGDFAKAVAAQREAIGLTDPQQGERYHESLKLYEAGKPRRRGGVTGREETGSE